MTVAERVQRKTDVRLAMTTRQQLPQRRPNQTVELTHNNMAFSVTLGYDLATGEPREVFTHGVKVGSTMDGILNDTCILLSILLQYGAKPELFVGSMGRLGDGTSPASIIGVIADVLAKETKL